MRIDNVYLAGIGSYLPNLVTTQYAVEAGWYDAQDRETSGVLSVAVSDSVPAPDMAVHAATAALRRSGHSPEDFGALLHSSTYHQGPDGWSAPHYVLNNTLDRPITALELRHGCLGMLSGLTMAAHRLTFDHDRDAVLITAADNFTSSLVDRWRTSKLFVLADGGAATVASRRGGFARLRSISMVSNSNMEALHRGDEPLFPPGVTVGRKMSFDDRLEYWTRLWAQGIAPPMAHFGEILCEAADQALEEAGVGWDKIVRVVHPAFARQPLSDQMLEPLGVDVEKSVWDFTRTVGHISTGDVFIGLEHLWLTGQVVPGDHVLISSATPGMEAGCSVVEIVNAPEGD